MPPKRRIEQEPLLGGGGRKQQSNDSSSSITIGILVAFLIAASALAIGFGVAWGAIKDTTKQCGPYTIGLHDECVDIAVIGSGAAGATLAEVVSRNGTYNTIVLEAGDDNYGKGDQNIVNPDGGVQTTFYYFVPQYFWPGESVHQGQLFQANNINYRYTNGRLLGGGTAINTMLVVRGTTNFWDNMDSQLGGTGMWASSNVHSVMKRQESLESNGFFTPGSTRGTTGRWSVSVRPTNGTTPDSYAIGVALNAALGLPFVPDYNAPGGELGINSRSQWQMRHVGDTYVRSTSVTAFLHAAVMNPITYQFIAPRRGRVQLRSTVQRLLWDPKNSHNCIGVEYIDADNGSVSKRIYATKSVVMSAGIRDAQMLQIEGIGPAATLATAGVSPRVVNEHVGRHYMNHVGALYVYLWPNMTGEVPDVAPGLILGASTFHMSDPSPAGTPGKREFQVVTFPFPFGFLLLTVHLSPLSEGTINIQNGDPSKMPLVDPAYFTDYRDVVSQREVLKTLTSAFASFDPNIVMVSNLNISSDADIDNFILNNIHFFHHWSSQTRMGTSVSDGVVDIRGRVFGTTGLRVASTSILRHVTDGNTGTPTVAIGDIIGNALVEDLL